MIHFVRSTRSTNDDVKAFAAAGHPEGTWLRAEEQSAGRGRQGREWASPSGNLHASTLVRLQPGNPAAPTLALVAAVALEEVVRSYLAPGADLLIKWPNDLLLGGAKLSGILLERENDAVVIGFGVNLVAAPDLPDRTATSLAAAGASVVPADFVAELAAAFARWLAIWRGQGLGPVRARWLERAHPVGTALTVRDTAGRPLEGLFAGLDGDGGLRLRTPWGERLIRAGDVFIVG